jgi:SsrA-binding protein
LAKGPVKGVKYITDNRKARHDYFIHETIEAGIALTGTEVKSLRQGHVNLKDSFCRIDNGEMFPRRGPYQSL